MKILLINLWNLRNQWNLKLKTCKQISLKNSKIAFRSQVNWEQLLRKDVKWALTEIRKRVVKTLLNLMTLTKYPRFLSYLLMLYLLQIKMMLIKDQLKRILIQKWTQTIGPVVLSIKKIQVFNQILQVSQFKFHKINLPLKRGNFLNQANTLAIKSH